MLKKSFLLCAITVLCSSTVWADADTDTRKEMIVESVKQHSAHTGCPCPYTVAKDGSSCGKRSAYNTKTGDEKPVCFESDITPKMLKDYKIQQK